MTKCVVLGGGGPVGIGWEAGLLVGLAESGVDLSAADAVVGTSAGSVVGFTLASGRDLTEATALVTAAAELAEDGVDGTPAGMEQLLSALAEATADPGSAGVVRAKLGTMALEARTIGEPRWLQIFESFAGADWPASFSCTAVDVADGTYRIWDRTSGVDPQLAVASSCAVPCVFPPVTIEGRRWMDGGVRDMVNADAAAGHATAVVVSCTLLELPEGFDLGPMSSILDSTRQQIDGLRHAGTAVETVVPGAEMLEVSGWGLNLMDFSLAGPAYESGVRQGRAEADRLGLAWGS